MVSGVDDDRAVGKLEVPGEVIVEGGAFGATRDIDKSQRVTIMTALFDGEVSMSRQVMGLREKDIAHSRHLCAHVKRPNP
jgi:hypothetical protein